MPDFLAGQTLTPLHFTRTESDTQNGSFTFNSTTFGVDADSGTYVDCGTTFVVPTTGRVKIDYAGELDNDTGSASTNVAPVVRTGGTVGSGTEIVAADLANAIRNIGTDSRRYGAHILVEGLVAGDTYNVRLEHRVSGGIATVQFRNVTVVPAT